MSARSAFPLLLVFVLACSGGGNPVPTNPGGGPGGGGPGGGGPASGWSSQVEIGAARDTFYVEIYGVDVDANEGGTAIGAWEEDGDTTGSAWIAWYRSGAWEAEVKVSDGFAHAVLPRVALNDAGAAVVAFEVVEHDGPGIASRTVWARRWVDGAWTAAERLSAAPGAPYEFYAFRPRVGIDGAGRALVAWDQQDNSTSIPASVYASRFDGTAWSAPSLVSGGTIYAAWPDVAVSADGTAAVVWVQDTNPYDPGQSTPSNPNIWARTFDGSDWSAPVRIGADLEDYDGCERPSVVMDAVGRAFAIWEEHKYNLDENRIAAAQLAPGGGWSARAVLDASPSKLVHRSFPSIATDGAGDAFAVWRSDSADGTTVNGSSARLDAAGGWGAAELFETTAEVSAACAAMDGAGNGWAIFTAGGLRARKHDPALGWQDARTIGTGIATDADANGAGAVIAGAHGTWIQYSPPAFLDAARATVYVP
jgi:hypothetical protein